MHTNMSFLFLNPQKYWAETSVFIVLYSKFIEFMDTMFFILRKHFRQLTFLHVYHHALTVIILWLGLRFLPRGPVILFPLLNTFVHTLMYTYYALTTLGYNMSSCKKYLTMIQIAQQTMFLIACLLYQINDCRYVKTLGKFVVVYVFSLLVLFFNFYVKSYIRGASNIEHNNKEMIKRKDE
ncbi:elongation of very long chain fatty acids protein 2-like [Biomphalaria glabrata]|uniref:Elongation of very long chain fatty acids protein n=1 Tax=Biomphalaria glabrata TaxID=6526 RepID=A0A9W3AC87_BIOGL|nr:elongation of very long chain fatty acids protein 2-like [Biomphalaria glabrata]